MSHSTRYAQLLKKYLQKCGLKVEEEVYDGHKHIDLSIDSAKLDIEVDGLQHLTNPEQILTDIKRSGYSREDGYETIHVHNVDLTYKAEAIAHAIAEVSEKREKDIDDMAGVTIDQTMTTQPLPNEEVFKKKLTKEQYQVLREKGTEAPFSGKLIHPGADGFYRCVACGNVLFKAEAKFDSGTGWPSFDEALPGAVKNVEDVSHGMVRTETVCAVCDSHLGHVFDDGPTQTGKRYCMNSVCFQEFDTNYHD
jgi:peptide-methionine (R)-S-oxide reductase